MKNPILHSIVFIVLLFPSMSGMAQFITRAGEPTFERSHLPPPKDIHEGRTLIMLTPQFVLVDQIRIEIDRRIRDRHWISFAPHYIQNNTEFQTHWGFGLGTMYRWFRYEGSSSYFGAGLQFTHHILENTARDEFTHTDYLWLYRANITQYGINLIIGRYIQLAPNIFSDIYVGIGYRISHVRTQTIEDELSVGTPTSFRNPRFSNNRFLAHDYQGLMLVFGVRFGIML